MLRFQTSNYQSKNSESLQIPKPRLKNLKKGFSYKAVKSWNNLPTNVRDKTSLKPHLQTTDLKKKTGSSISTYHKIKT